MCYRRVLRLSVVAMALAVAMIVAAAVSASAADNTACTSCHSSSGEWAVGDVDRSTACAKCHTQGLLGAHPYHNPGSNCGAVCHPGWGASLQYATPAWRGAEGSFASADSVDVPASVLHVIHSTPRWLAQIDTASSNCASCHSTAACTACHEDEPTDGHADHSATGNVSYPQQAPWTGVMGSGITGEDQTIDSAAEQTNQCATPGCHNLAGTQARIPISREDNGVGVVKDPVANWQVKYGSNYTAGRISYASRVNTKITFTFTGQQVEVVSDKDPYRGILAISVDGGPEQMVDCYSSITAYQKVVFRSDVMDAGSHTISVRVTGTKNPAARAAYAFLDAFRFYGVMPESISPACISCHTVGSDHGFSHVASLTAGTYDSFACASCHDLTLTGEHARPSSVTQPAGCTACHTTYADYDLDLYNYTCSQAGGAGAPACHQGASVPHTAKDASHTVTPVAETADCIACHSDDLGVIHDDSNPARPQHASLTGGGSNGLSYSTDCLTCHSSSAVPSAKDCTSAQCHVASGVVSMATHPAPDHDADPAVNEALRTGGEACSLCHAVNAITAKVELVGEHGKTTSQTDADASIGCMSCHGAPYFPTDWLGQNNTCVACHPSDDSKAGAPHEASEYNAKHDFTADAGNGLSCGAGAGTVCHDTATVDLLHDESNPGTADCDSCHTAAVRQAGVPTVRACVTCHPVGHDQTKHITTASAACTSCHGSADVRDVHASCETCHENPGYPGLTSLALDAECVSCHAAGGALATSDYAPVDPEHATGSETTHTATPFTAAYQGAGADGTVAAEGKQCSICHSATLKPAHSATSSNGGSVTCVECHTDTTLGSAAVVSADWTAKKCTDCHDSGAASTHDAYGTTHVVVAGACAGTAGCHADTDLAKLHDKNQAGGTAKYQSCGNSDAGDPSACHATMDTRPARWASDAASCGEGTAGCHQDKSPSNHGKRHTLTIASSVYADGAGEGVPAGCLSSGGGGCHDSLGTGNTSVDIADYHQTTECADSVCHTSVDKPTHLQPFVCADCHDSTYAGATDTVALSDIAPNGHYPSGNHLATGGLGNVNTGGSASETCSTCHDLSLLDAHTGIASPTKGSNVTCAECHGYNLNVTSQVKVASWSTDSCSDCHNASVIAASVQHANSVAVAVPATASAGCASSGRNCHNSSDLHAIHSDAPAGCDLSGCHDAANKNIRPTKKSCGATGECHTTGFNTNTSFPTHSPSEEASHAPTTNTQETATWSVASQTVACGACHLVSFADGGLLSEHVLPSSAMTVTPGNACQNCHGSSASDASIAGTWATNRNTANACATCHSASNAIAVHANENAAAHTDVTSASCGNTGAGCHPTNNLAQVGTPSTTANIHLNCLRCHDHTGSATVPAPGGGNMKWDPAKDTCGNGRECHNIAGQYPVAGDPVHRNGLADAANGDDTAHHTGVTANKTNYPETAAGVYSDNLACTGCHSNTLKTAHSVTSTNGGAVTCLECHNGSGAITAATAAGQVKANWSTDKCTDCHTPVSTHASFKTGAATYSATHSATMNAGCSGSGTGCHGSRPDSLTAVSPAGEMAQLHPTPGCSANSGTSATSCHALNKPMAAIGKTCGTGSNCHNTYTTTAGHANNTITANDTTHTVTAASMDTSADATFAYGVQCKNCHSSGLRSAHTTVTVAMESGNTWAAGASPYCTNCHNATTPDNAASVIKTTTWNKTCDACHVTSGNGKHARYTAASHTATTSGCTLASGCHGFSGSQSMDIRALHNRVTSGCTASGTDSRGWSGGCHALDKSMVGTTMTCGDTGACHNAHTATNHVPNHDIDSIVPTANKISGAAYSYHGVSYTPGNSWGCGGCHFTDLIKEHGTVASGGAGRTMDDGGSGCGVCHTNMGGTVGASASRSSIVAAISAGNGTSGDMRCVTCHTGNLTDGTAAPHVGAATVTGSKQRTTGNPLAEFISDGTDGDGLAGGSVAGVGKSGGHNIAGNNYYAKIDPSNGTAQVLWPYAPGVAAPFVGTNPRTGATWTRTDQLLCSDCHRFSASAVNGPQGAAAVYQAWAGGTTYTTAKNWYNGLSPYVLNGETGTYGMCSGCHGTLSSTAHGQGNHNLPCIRCHSRIPHGGTRPRLLAYGTDAAPYNSVSGLTGVGNGAPPNSSNNCNGSGCGKHTKAAPYW